MCHIICEFYTYGKEEEKNIAFRYLAKLMARQKLGRWAHHTQVNDYFLDIIIACIPNSWLTQFDWKTGELNRLEQPALELKWYFGTDVTYYFLWLAKYIRELQFPALIGLIVTIVHLVTENGRVKEAENRAQLLCKDSSSQIVSTNTTLPLGNATMSPQVVSYYSSDEYFVSTSIYFISTLIYCGTIFIWSIHFASTWEAYEKRFALLFGYTETGHKDDVLEPNFNFHGVTTRNVVTDELEKDYEDKLIWKCNLWFSRTTMFMLLILVLASVVSLIFFKILMDNVFPTYGVIVVGL